MKKTEKGFTIIEVALVLAIGALIFLVVFLAVPALQRNQRNDARKRDISNVVEAVSDYNSNNPGRALTHHDPYRVGRNPLKQGALGNHIDTLSNSIDVVEVVENGTMLSDQQNSPTNVIRVHVGFRCNGLDNITQGSGRQAAVVGVMEQTDGRRSRYCQDAS